MKIERTNLTLQRIVYGEQNVTSRQIERKCLMLITDNTNTNTTYFYFHTINEEGQDIVEEYATDTPKLFLDNNIQPCDLTELFKVKPVQSTVLLKRLIEQCKFEIAYNMTRLEPTTHES